jgi:hypothetical protein
VAPHFAKTLGEQIKHRSFGVAHVAARRVKARNKHTLGISCYVCPGSRKSLGPPLHEFIQNVMNYLWMHYLLRWTS